MFKLCSKSNLLPLKFTQLAIIISLLLHRYLSLRFFDKIMRLLNEWFPISSHHIYLPLCPSHRLLHCHLCQLKCLFPLFFLNLYFEIYISIMLMSIFLGFLIEIWLLRCVIIKGFYIYRSFKVLSIVSNELQVSFLKFLDIKFC